MKMQTILVFVATLFVVIGAHDLGVETFLKDKTFVNKEIDCMLNKAPCDIIGQMIKDILPDALNNDCGHCSSIQAKIMRRLMDFMETSHPELNRQIRELYPPNQG
ncbi:ejaculatory bulb-specific protein 3-like [Diachasmimorpha longicaudata]|uniref:ejaculatory bulb-specific protein 3-like n=1 Tax=Diachasmimorpha longicaudata TaxID=58733 RepID=UPI0030B8A528